MCQHNFAHATNILYSLNLNSFGAHVSIRNQIFFVFFAVLHVNKRIYVFRERFLFIFILHTHDDLE
jgi:hypothetical protein